jgi:long-subunit fatty acid transport protein
MVRKVILFIILILSISVIPLRSQSIPFTAGQTWEIGARALGMGGSHTGVADDPAALYYNPAGLGQIQAMTGYGSFSHMTWKDRATFLGRESLEEASFTKLDAVGIAVPLPTERGSLVLSFGYHRVRSFGGGLNLKEGDADVDYTIQLEGTDYTLPFETTLSGEEMVDGELSQTSFGGSMEIAPDVYIGGAVNFWSGMRDYAWQFNQIRGIYDVNNIPNPGDQWEVMLPDVEYQAHYQEKYSGFNFSLGTLVKAGKALQIGGVIKTPVKLVSKRDWDSMERLTVYPGYEAFQEDDIVDAGYIDHEIQLPWVFRVGGALKAGPFLLSGDVEHTDYSQMKYKTDPPEGDQTMSEANREIRRDYRSTLDVHVGGEVTLPAGVKLRAGYAHYPTPLKETQLGLDRKVITFGAGFSFADQFRLDVAYAFTSWDGIPDDLVEKERVEVNKVLVTLSYWKK